MTRRDVPRHRAGPLFGAVLVVVTALLAFTPVVPRVGAVDPTPTPSEIASPSPDSSASPSADPSPSAPPDPSPDPTPSPSIDPSPSPDPTSPSPDPSPADPAPSPSPDPSASPDPGASPSPGPSPEPVRGSLVLTSDAPPSGRHRIDPGAILDLVLAAGVEGPASDVRLVVELPPGWTVIDPSGGTVDPSARAIEWTLGDVVDTRQAVLSPRLRAPVRSPDGAPAFAATIDARLEHADGVAATDSVTVLVAPAARGGPCGPRPGRARHAGAELPGDRRGSRERAPVRCLPRPVPGPQRRRPGRQPHAAARVPRRLLRVVRGHPRRRVGGRCPVLRRRGMAPDRSRHRDHARDGRRADRRAGDRHSSHGRRDAGAGSRPPRHGPGRDRRDRRTRRFLHRGRVHRPCLDRPPARRAVRPAPLRRRAVDRRRDDRRRDDRIGTPGPADARAAGRPRGWRARRRSIVQPSGPPERGLHRV